MLDNAITIIAGGAAAIIAILWGLLKRRTSQRDEATARADAEQEGRERIQNVHSKVREVESDIRTDDAERRRERLRDYASGTRDTD